VRIGVKVEHKHDVTVPRGRTVGVAFGVFVAFMLVGFPAWQAINGMPEDVTVMDLRLSYTPDELYAALSALGEAGRAAYVRNILILDLAWPLVYGTFLTLLPLYAFADKPPRRRRLLAGIAVVGVILDYAENMSVLTLVLRFPDRVDALARVASGFTTAKWVFVSAAMVVAVAAAVALVRRSLSARTARRSVG
jgi:uncharacterized membrane protein YoaT (DUF817 family)